MHKHIMYNRKRRYIWQVTITYWDFHEVISEVQEVIVAIDEIKGLEVRFMTQVINKVHIKNDLISDKCVGLLLKAIRLCLEMA